MFSIFLSVLTVLVVVGVALLIRWLWRSLRPVDRDEVERFVQQSGLVLTVDNGPRVVDAIARTRFWRALGVLIAFMVFVVLTVVSAVRNGSLHVSMLGVLGMLFGYHVGSVLAELRTARRTAGPGPRSASIVPRESANYIGDWARRWPIVLGVTGPVAAAMAFAAGEGELWWVAAGLGASAVALTTALVTRYVLERPQIAEAADLQAADDAIRSRSLHALTGSAVGIQLWLVSLTVGVMLIALAERFVSDDVVKTSVIAPFVLLIFAVLIPIRATMEGRRYSRRAFRVTTPSASVSA